MYSHLQRIYTASEILRNNLQASISSLHLHNSIHTGWTRILYNTPFSGGYAHHIPRPAISSATITLLVIFRLVRKIASTPVSFVYTGAKAPVMFSSMKAAIALQCHFWAALHWNTHCSTVFVAYNISEESRLFQKPQQMLEIDVM
jgi:hypothetical protein